MYHQNLWNSFPKSESGLPIYPDEYAGTYLDETGNLIILLTTINDELKNKYELRCQTHEGILFRQVEYSLNELSEYVSYATDYIRNGVDVTRYGIHVSDNSFEILLSSDSPAPLNGITAIASGFPIKFKYQEESVSPCSMLWGGDRLINNDTSKRTTL